MGGPSTAGPALHMMLGEAAHPGKRFGFVQKVVQQGESLQAAGISIPQIYTYPRLNLLFVYSRRPAGFQVPATTGRKL